MQIAVTRPTDAPVIGTETPEPARNDSAGPRLGYRPATVEQPFGQNINAVLISPPETPADLVPLPNAAAPPGQPPRIISRAQWGADEWMRCGEPRYDTRIQAGVVHHTAGSNDYAPGDSAGIVRSIYEYHTRTLGWCDIAYNALVDKYGQVFEGRAGGMDRPVEGAATGGFNHDTWGVAMLGNFEVVPPTPIQLRTTARLLGWVLGQAGVDPRGTVVLPSEGGSFTKFPFGVIPDPADDLHPPRRRHHRVPGQRGVRGDGPDPRHRRTIQRTAGPRAAGRDAARRGDLREMGFAGRHEQLPGQADVARGVGGGLGALCHLRTGRGVLVPGKWRRARSPARIYKAWGALGFERGALGLPTSAEIAEPLWIVQNFQHGTLNFDRENGTVTRVIDGVPVELPPPPAESRSVQLERFTPPINPV